MKVSFREEYWEKLYTSAPIGKPKFSQDIVKRYRRVIRTVSQVENTNMLRQFKGLRFEALAGNLKGYHSLRVNKQYRIIVTVLEREIQLDRVMEEEVISEEMNKHYQ
ncbi:type II toxin-antitoxin system RelE/ParE family toxin [Tunicatimonas pelagia]|uniref:type II toxin-antitoxin system RelE/ParE family toxin n=1 Tax=Tunicatimonas pelagia TaxID=931531 RepID=UPI002666B555|nr:type II toxin-antitoxin system RelE/ParE family toxin [Tunicatimonas pelagia]WKN41548.1 type II toxin-antitoxin system RelE/ParE family toxin [Tunicatimonas pelagia]